MQVIDPVEDYVVLMQSIFDFNQIKQLLASGKLKVSFHISDENQYQLDEDPDPWSASWKNGNKKRKKYKF